MHARIVFTSLLYIVLVTTGYTAHTEQDVKQEAEDYFIALTKKFDLFARHSFQAEYEFVDSNNPPLSITVLYSVQHSYSLITLRGGLTELDKVYVLLDFSKREEGNYYLKVIRNGEGMEASFPVKSPFAHLDNPLGALSLIIEMSLSQLDAESSYRKSEDFVPTISLFLDEENFQANMGTTAGTETLVGSWNSFGDAANDIINVEETTEQIVFSYNTGRTVWIDKETGLLIKDIFPVPEYSSPREILQTSYLAPAEEVPFILLLPDLEQIKFERMDATQMMVGAIFQWYAERLAETDDFDFDTIYYDEFRAELVAKIRDEALRIVREDTKEAMDEEVLSQSKSMLMGNYKQFLSVAPEDVVQEFSFVDYLNLRIDAMKYYPLKSCGISNDALEQYFEGLECETCIQQLSQDTKVRARIDKLYEYSRFPLAEGAMRGSYIGPIDAVITQESGGMEENQGEKKDKLISPEQFNRYKGYLYRGGWSEDKPDGLGIRISIYGDTYEGEFTEGIPNGYGVSKIFNGIHHEGEWKDGKRHGKGITIKGETRFEGVWEHDFQQGHGVAIYPDGTRYEGEFEDGWVRGQGVFISPDGSRFEGLVMDGEPVEGVLHGPDGARYEGGFLDKKPHGQGVLVGSDGSRYEGTFINGQPEGVDNCEDAEGSNLCDTFEAHAALQRGDYVTALKLIEPMAEQGNAWAQASLGQMYSKGDGVTQDYKKAVKWWRKAAEQEHREAQYDLGVMYANGQGVAQDYGEAVKWYRKSADQGYALAQGNLGVLLEGGYGVEKNVTQALFWWRKAAEQGNAPSQMNLAAIYRDGKGVIQDSAQAVKWWRMAADQGRPDAQSNLAASYATGIGVAQDYEQALNWYHKAAEQGQAHAQFGLGIMYEKGQGLTQDYKQAFKWYRKAAEQGYAEAQYKLALMYAQGLGIPQNKQAALDWVRKAAEQGHAKAQYNLGTMFHGGSEVPQDYSQAFKWYQKAAEQGNTEAQYQLAIMYYEGWGTSQDYPAALNLFREAAVKGHTFSQHSLANMLHAGKGVTKDTQAALMWYRKAAEQGYAEAQFRVGGSYWEVQNYKEAIIWYRKAAKRGHAGAQNNLGDMYENGHGVPQNYKKALEWYRKAAEQGGVAGQYSLGTMYRDGNEVATDIIKAYAWFDLAASNGMTKAKEDLELFSSHMTKEQIATAQELAKEWKVKYSKK